ncbi:MAG: response regulator transcription factor [SAR324 cluster bacterium]|nr:response regulator transcription factor [SAR324 cluster bacterium]
MSATEKPMYVFIADDHTVFRTALKVLLEQDRAFRVIGDCETGAEAITACADPDIDLLILDISLGDMAAQQVVKAILDFRPALPIVILTMHEDELYLRDLFQLQALNTV